MAGRMVGYAPCLSGSVGHWGMLGRASDELTNVYHFLRQLFCLPMLFSIGKQCGIVFQHEGTGGTAGDDGVVGCQ